MILSRNPNLLKRHKLGCEVHDLNYDPSVKALPGWWDLMSSGTSGYLKPWQCCMTGPLLKWIFQSQVQVTPLPQELSESQSSDTRSEWQGLCSPRAFSELLMASLGNWLIVKQTSISISSRGRKKRVFQRGISIFPNKSHFLFLVFWILCCIGILKPEEQALACLWTTSRWKFRTQWLFQDRSPGYHTGLTPHCLTNGESFQTCFLLCKIKMI